MTGSLVSDRSEITVKGNRFCRLFLFRSQQYQETGLAQSGAHPQGAGLSKTHLLHALGNHRQENGPNVLYVSHEESTNGLINPIRSHTLLAFRVKYRTFDVLFA